MWTVGFFQDVPISLTSTGITGGDVNVDLLRSAVVNIRLGVVREVEVVCIVYHRKRGRSVEREDPALG